MTDFSDLYIAYSEKGNKIPRGRHCYITQLALLAAGNPNSNLRPLSTRDPGGLYVMVNKRVCPVQNTMPYWTWYQRAERHISQTWVKDGKASRNTVQDAVWISTVFLGMDHSFCGPPPVLFETMCFGHKEEYQSRATTIEDAKINHKTMVEQIIQETKGVKNSYDT